MEQPPFLTSGAIFRHTRGKGKPQSQQLPDTELREVTLHPEECSWPQATLLIPSYSFIFTCKPHARLAHHGRGKETEGVFHLGCWGRLPKRIHLQPFSSTLGREKAHPKWL